LGNLAATDRLLLQMPNHSFTLDLVVICKELTVVQQCQQILSEWLGELGLELKPEKTRLVHTLEEYGGEKPRFNFLGFSIR